MLIHTHKNQLIFNINNIDGKTKLLGIIGKNIDYSLSPLIHNLSCQKLKINALYLPINIDEQHIESALNIFFNIGALGFNVTQPYKELIAKLINSSCQSVNVLYRTKSGWSAISTDALGLDLGLQRLKFKLTAFKKIVLIGSGGTVTSIIEYLCKDQHFDNEIIVCRRNPYKDQILRQCSDDYKNLGFVDLNCRNLAEQITKKRQDTILIQATNAPLSGDFLDDLVPAMAEFSGVFVDLVYHQPSKLFVKAKQRKLVCQNGLPMLLEQARLAQNYWFGRSVSYNVLQKYFF